jgi:hypothetical protein
MNRIKSPMTVLLKGPGDKTIGCVYFQIRLYGGAENQADIESLKPDGPGQKT